MTRQPLTALDFFILRTPLLPYHTAQDLSGKSLGIHFANDVLKEALFLASPVVSKLLQKWLDGKTDDSRQEEKLLVTLGSYLLRASARPTPFGIFAGISTGRFGASTNLELSGPPGSITHCRLDMGFQSALQDRFLSIPKLRRNLTFHSNNTIYPVAHSLRYLSFRVESGRRRYYLEEIDDADGVVRSLVRRARTGAKFTDLRDCLLLKVETTHERADQFIDELVHAQVLVSELEMPVTGSGNTLPGFLSIVQEHCEPGLLEKLHNVSKLMDQASQVRPGGALPHYQALEERMAMLLPEHPQGRMIQVDCRNGLLGEELNASITDRLKQAIRLLASTGSLTTDAKGDNLGAFRKAFRHRYDTREVPLLEVMDAEMGIGYPAGGNSPDPNHIRNSIGDPDAADETTHSHNGWHSFLLAGFQECLRQKKHVMQLTQAQLGPFLDNGKERPFGGSLYSLVQIMAASPEAVDAGDFKIIHHHTDGPSMANLLGRFCHMDEKLTGLVREALDAEEALHNSREDCVLAEVVHVDQNRNANIALRPVLRHYEIPIFTRPGVSPEFTLGLDDLTVSLYGDEIVLRSRRLNKRVLPRMSNGHNYALGELPVYRFLCELQKQNGIGYLAFDWGGLAQAGFLPRVEFENVILAPAQWSLGREDVEALNNAKHFQGQLALVREKTALPTSVVIEDGDNALPLDLTDEAQLKILQSHLKGRQRVVLKENLIGQTAWIPGPGGNFTHELIIPWQGSSHTGLGQPLQPEADKGITRDFPPGTEWLYFKIYAGIQTVEMLMVQVLGPLAQALLLEKTIDKWFFIRYNDVDGHHLRIRFHGKGDFYARVLHSTQTALEPYRDSNLIWKMQVDTYTRELERYGECYMDDTETLFFHDSQSVARLLAVVKNNPEDGILREKIALMGLDTLLGDFGYGLAQKLDFFDWLGEAFKKEFPFEDQSRQLTALYRTHRPMIMRVLGGTEDSEALMGAYQICKERSKAIAPFAPVLRKEKVGIKPFESRLGGYVHMFVNRMFVSRQNKHELILFDWMSQYYKSVLARRGGSGKHELKHNH